MLVPDTLTAAKQDALLLASDLSEFYNVLADAGFEAEPLGYLCDRANDLSVSLGNESVYPEGSAVVPAKVA